LFRQAVVVVALALLLGADSPVDLPLVVLAALMEYGQHHDHAIFCPSQPRSDTTAPLPKATRPACPAAPDGAPAEASGTEPAHCPPSDADNPQGRPRALTQAPTNLDLLVTGLVVGAGTKPLHDMISQIQTTSGKSEAVSASTTRTS
jgi:hypothetical protein